MNQIKRKPLLNLIVMTFIVSVFGIVVVSCSNETQSKHSDGKSEQITGIKSYTCGMHPSVNVSPEEYAKGATSCPICNMNLTPVYAEEGKETREKKILFYRNPMNPEITSDVPAKDSMGMDYVPVYEEAESESTYYGCGMEGEEHVYLLEGEHEGMKCPMCNMKLKKLSEEEADNLRGVLGKVEVKGEQAKLAGVATEQIKKQHLFKEIRTVGKVAYDPQLAIAQEELISTLKALDKMGEGSTPEIRERASSLAESSKRKLKLLGMSSDQIEELATKRLVSTNLILPEETMWIYGEMYENDLSWVKPGGKIKITTASIPGEEFSGVISSVNPVIDSKTRSVTFRAQVNNPNLKLKPEMYVDVVVMSMLNIDGKMEILAIPKGALLDTGVRKIVWVDKGNGKYEGKEVIVGPEATVIIEGKTRKFYPVLKGLSEADSVVTKANFLIDSQSQLSGTASSAYGGALGSKESETSPSAHVGH